MQANKLLPLVFGIILLLFGLWLYKTNERPKIVSMVSVEVGGFVASPGIYQLSAGSRVEDLLNISGGLTKDVKNINRVAVLKDGQKINIK